VGSLCWHRYLDWFLCFFFFMWENNGLSLARSGKGPPPPPTVANSQWDHGDRIRRNAGTQPPAGAVVGTYTGR